MISIELPFTILLLKRTCPGGRFGWQLPHFCLSPCQQLSLLCYSAALDSVQFPTSSLAILILKSGPNDTSMIAVFFINHLLTFCFSYRLFSSFTTLTEHLQSNKFAKEIWYLQVESLNGYCYIRVACLIWCLMQAWVNKVNHAIKVPLWYISWWRKNCPGTCREPVFLSKVYMKYYDRLIKK